MRLREDESGQLMMLAGIVLTISFILTALTLSQVAQLEREAARQTASPIIGEWRFLHERLAGNLRIAVGPETTIQSFADSVLPTVQATFRTVEAEKGYDLTMRLASDAAYAEWGNEPMLHDGTTYDAWSWDGTHIGNTLGSSDPDDGVLWGSDCDAPGALPGGCIVGVYLHVRLTDGVNTLQESMLFATN